MRRREFSLEGKLFLYMLYFSIFLSVVCIVGNIAIGYPFFVNYKWFASIIVAAIALKFVYRDKHVAFIQTLVFCFIIFALLPIGWVTSGGSNNFTIAYAFLLIIMISYLFYGRTRIVFLISTIAILIGLLLLEQLAPALFAQHDPALHALDMFIQIPLTLTVASLMVKVFADAYRNERDKLQEYSELLHEKNEKLKELSITDELTGLFNRRYVYTKLEEAKKSNESLSLIIIDIDNFKKVNDVYGHLAGDQVIKKLSKLLKDVVGEKGMVGRIGGDEFLIITHSTNIAYTKKVAQEILEGANQLPFEHVPSVSVSGGTALFTPDQEISEAIESADQMLYKVKSSGKGDILVNGK